MIPRKIHYCWFGGCPKPPKVEAMIATWRAAMPGFEIKEWNETNFDASAYPYAAEALATGNWAHLSDVCRMYALYTEGGIYLDTDVEVLSGFGSFMGDPSFVGMEEKAVGTGVIGSEPGQEWVGSFLDFYRSRHFINFWGHEVRTPNPVLLTEVILPQVAAADRPKVYPFDVFCAKRYTTGEIAVTAHTVAIHHFDASWRGRKTLALRIKSCCAASKSAISALELCPILPRAAFLVILQSVNVINQAFKQELQ